MTINLPTDAELDATVARLEPELFLRIGARSRRRRGLRVVAGCLAGAGLLLAGTFAGAVLVRPVAAPVASPTGASSGASYSVDCRGADDARGGTVQITAPATFSATSARLGSVCEAVAGSGVLRFGPEAGPAAGPSPALVCSGGQNSAVVYLVPASATTTCESHDSRPWTTPAGTK